MGDGIKKVYFILLVENSQTKSSSFQKSIIPFRLQFNEPLKNSVECTINK